MTEEEWLSATDPTPMLEFLRGKASDRKLRLFAVACCRRVEKYLTDQRCIRALEIIEQNVDRSRHDPCFATASDYSYTVWTERHHHVLASIVGDDLARRHFVSGALWDQPDRAAAEVAIATADGDAITSAACAVWCAAGSGEVDDEKDFLLCRAEVTTLHAAKAAGTGSSEQNAQATLLHCIFNPFHLISLNPTWQTSTVLALAQGIYQDRAFDRLPILADALLDSGCDNPDLLNHLRSEGPHTRGCWCIDLLTNRE